MRLALTVVSALVLTAAAVVSDVCLSVVKAEQMAAKTEDAEFGGRCVMALAQGQIVETTCGVVWTSPDSKRYCFRSEDAKTEFLKDVEKNLSKARDYYATHANTVPKTKAFTEADAEDAVQSEIKARSREGIFIHNDARTGEALRLKFDTIKITRGMAGYGWFPNVIFHDVENMKKQYAIDFWFKEDGDKLSLMDIRIQKAPVKDGDGYYMKTRFPVAWWWLPVSEHPGDPEVTRAWHVMSAIHRHIANNTKDGVFELKDEKNGQMIPLEFVEMHMPIRRLKGDGRFFACTDFRKKGSKSEFYDIDFWLDKKTGQIEVGSVRIHKVPVQDQENGLWYQQKRYDFRGLEFDVVN